MSSYQNKIRAYLGELWESLGRIEYPEASEIAESVGCSLRTAEKWLDYIKEENGVAVQERKLHGRALNPETTARRKLIDSVNRTHGLNLPYDTGVDTDKPGTYSEYTILSSYHNVPLKTAIENCIINGTDSTFEISLMLDVPEHIIKRYMPVQKHRRRSRIRNRGKTRR